MVRSGGLQPDSSTFLLTLGVRWDTVESLISFGFADTVIQRLLWFSHMSHAPRDRYATALRSPMPVGATP